MNIKIDNTKETETENEKIIYKFLEYIKSCYIGEEEFTEDEFFCELADGEFWGLMYNTSLYEEWEKVENQYDKFEKYLETKGYIYKHLYRSDSGGEGRGEYCQGVFSLNGIAYSVEWSYYSFQGYRYDGASETLRVVKPTQKTITIYE